MSALVVSAVVSAGDVHVCEPHYVQRRKRAAKKWGDGRCLKLRVEPEEEAYTYADLKRYWGFIVRPFAEYTGYHAHEAHLMLKAECMPEGKTSITELSREELKAYADAAEHTAREWCPDAFILYDAMRN